MANIAPLVNTRGPLFVHSGGIVKRPHFHAFAMYANLLQKRVVDAKVTNNKLTHGNESLAVVEAIATIDESAKHWAIALVNRHPTETVACSVNIVGELLNGSYKATVLTGASPDAYNDIANPDRVAPREQPLTFSKGMASLPPHSLTIIRIPVKQG